MDHADGVPARSERLGDDSRARARSNDEAHVEVFALDALARGAADGAATLDEASTLTRQADQPDGSRVALHHRARSRRCVSDRHELRQLPRGLERAGVSARRVGALAVAGVVVAFSLSSTLVKRAHTPGVLLAFWRMVTVSVVWNVFLQRPVVVSHGAREAGVRIPGSSSDSISRPSSPGATHNSVANAALIGSLSPFLIVPIGARLFKEHLDPRALVFALVAFGGLVIVLFSAPANGDASLRGNVFGVIAMVLWTAYVASTRHFRRDMDVATFMATISPIAAMAVLPLAIANGDVFEMSRTGWTYMLILTFLIGMAAQD